MFKTRIKYKGGVALRFEYLPFNEQIYANFRLFWSQVNTEH